MSELTYLQAIRETLRDELRRDGRVFVIGEDVGVYGGAFKVTEGFQEEFGEWRVIDAPLAETAIVGACTGAALVGMRPVAELQFADFVSCAWDHLTTVPAKQHYRAGTPISIVVRCPSGGGFSGGPFHSQNPESSERVDDRLCWLDDLCVEDLPGGLDGGELKLFLGERWRRRSSRPGRRGVRHMREAGRRALAAVRAEFDTNPGPVRDKIASVELGWTELLQRLIQGAQAAGSISETEDPAQLAFELHAYLLMGNIAFVLYGDAAVPPPSRRGDHQPPVARLNGSCWILNQRPWD